MIEQHYGHVQISNIGKDLNKRKNTANTEQAKDIEMASTLIGKMKRGELDVDSVAKVLESIAKK